MSKFQESIKGCHIMQHPLIEFRQIYHFDSF
nr:MAG TPA: hypothetical protein [Caudoviricetes sp.]